MLACAFASAVAMPFMSEPQSVADEQEGVAAAEKANHPDDVADDVADDVSDPHVSSSV